MYKKFFQAAQIDLDAAKILTKESNFPPALYHLQQAYEKCIKSYYIFLEITINNTSADEAYEKSTYRLGHDTEESTIDLLQDLAQLEINSLQFQLSNLTETASIEGVNTVISAIHRYKKSLGDLVTELDLESRYFINILNYEKYVQDKYDYIKKLLTK